MIYLPDGKFLTLGLQMLVKDEEGCLEACFKSLQPIREIFDEITVGWTGTNPTTKALLDQYATNVFPVKWEHHHGEARQQVHEAMTSDLVMWLDADDLVLNPQELPALLSQAFSDTSIGAIWLNYLYAVDAFGNVDSFMKRERIVRRSWFQWIGSLHENLLVNDRFARTCFDERPVPVEIKHNSSPERMAESQRRCLEIATHQIKKEREAGEIDARTVLDLARGLMTNGLWEEALKSFEEYIHLCGWDEMRYYALNLMADIYRNKEDYEKAKNCNHLASIMKPMWPEAYVGLAKTSFKERQWPEVIFWCETVSRSESPAGLIPCNPTLNTIWPLRVLHLAYAHKGDFAKAIIICEKALECYPNDEELTKCLEQWQQAQRHIWLQSSLEDVQRWLEEHKEEDKLQYFIKAIPESMSDLPGFVRLKNQLYPPKHGKQRIVIFCGKSYEEWDPRNVGTGIGGSEEAVIYLAPLLAQQGYIVDVYGNLRAEELEKEFLGVRWKHWHTYDKDNDPGDIFIAWRLPDYIDFAPTNATTRIFLWCHDALKAEHWNEDRMARVEKVFVLSKYHRTFGPPGIPEEKYFYTRNGIVVDDFMDEGPRDPFKCVYMSSPDRGLEIVLRNWAKIKAAVPQATMDIYYGFTRNFDELNKGNYVKIKWKQEMLEACLQPGLNYKGRRSHQEIAVACRTGQLFTYPCTFSEISCISAMKAQCGGLIPVVFDFASLPETIQYGVRIPYKDLDVEQKWTAAVIRLLQTPADCEEIRKPMRAWALKTYGWQGVADQWVTFFQSCRHAGVETNGQTPERQKALVS